MNFQHKCATAKRVASILEEAKATVSDLEEIFSMVKKDLIVTAIKFPESHSYGFGIRIPEPESNNCRTRVASILAGAKATVSDLEEIFSMVKKDLIVTAIKFPPSHSYGHDISITDPASDNCRIGDE